MDGASLEVLLAGVGRWGYTVVFGVTFLETSAFLGLLVPGESLVVVAGLLASVGVLRPLPVALVALAGAVLGDNVGYLLGRRWGEPLVRRFGRTILLRAEHLDEARGFYAAHGGKTVFFGRFMSWLRAFGPVAAGMSGMPWLRFLLFDAAGAAAWATLFTLLGFFLGHSWGLVKHYLDRIGAAAFAAGILLLWGLFLYRRRRKAIVERAGRLDTFLSARFPWVWGFVKGRFRTSAWHGLRLTAALVLLSLAVFAFRELVEGLVEEPVLLLADRWLQGILEGLISPGVTRFMAAFTDAAAAGLAAAALVLMVVLHLVRRSWWDLYTLGLATASGQVLLVLLKHVFSRPRPQPELMAASGYSFPSGHAFNAMLFGGLFVLLLRSLPAPAWLRGLLTALAATLVLAVGFSRMYLNVHWLTDVLAGYSAGLAWLMVSVILARTVRHLAQPAGERPPRD